VPPITTGPASDSPSPQCRAMFINRHPYSSQGPFVPNIHNNLTMDWDLGEVDATCLSRLLRRHDSAWRPDPAREQPGHFGPGGNGRFGANRTSASTRASPPSLKEPLRSRSLEVAARTPAPTPSAAAPIRGHVHAGESLDHGSSYPLIHHPSWRAPPSHPPQMELTNTPCGRSPSHPSSPRAATSLNPDSRPAHCHDGSRPRLSRDNGLPGQDGYSGRHRSVRSARQPVHSGSPESSVVQVAATRSRGVAAMPLRFDA
jgi:hypothetical protein